MSVAGSLSSTIGLAERPDLRVGPLDISPSTRAILGPGGRQVVEPRVMQVLLALADADGRVVSRERLFELCWGGVNVGEDSLNRAVAELRRVTRHIGGGELLIETVPRVGYRLVSPALPEPEVRSLNTQKLPPPAPRLSRRAALVGGAALVAGSAWWALRPDPVSARVDALLEQGMLAARSGLPDAEAQGAGFFEEAVKLQPDNAKAWGKLALARTAMAEFGAPDQITQASASAQQAAARALALEPNQADAQGALAILPPYYGDWTNAERRMRAVLADHPDHPPTRDALAFMLVGTGRAREGSADRVRMAALDPLNVNQQFRLIYAHWILGNVGAMDRAAERALQLWPKHPGVWFARLYTLAFTGRPNRALAHAEDAASRPDLPPALMQASLAAVTALVSGKASDRASATEMLLRTVVRGPSGSVNGMTLLAGIGEVDRAFDLANAYLLERGPLMASVRWRRGDASINDARRRKTHPLFIPSSAAMREDPRFMPLVEQIGLADYWRAAGVKPDFLR